MTLESAWTLERTHDVALVGIEVSNEGPVDRRVRVRNALDGPVLPPRTRGVPDPGWDEEGYTGVVGAGATLALGYACPVADPTDPPVDVVDEGRATDADDADPVDGAVRRLGDPTPPVDAVRPNTDPLEADDAGSDASVDVSAVTDARASKSTETDESDPTESVGASPVGFEPSTTGSADGSESGDALADVEAFAAVERRIERAERLADGTVEEATAVLEDAGGLRAVEDLPARLDADASALRALGRRADRLADRAEATDVSIDALRRLA